MDFDVYVLDKDGAAGRRRGLIVHIAQAGKEVGKSMVLPFVRRIKVVDAPADWAKTVQIGAHQEGELRLKSRWVLDLPQGTVVSFAGLPMVDRLPAARAVHALGGKVEG